MGTCTSRQAQREQPPVSALPQEEEREHVVNAEVTDKPKAAFDSADGENGNDGDRTANPEKEIDSKGNDDDDEEDEEEDDDEEEEDEDDDDEDDDDDDEEEEGGKSRNRKKKSEKTFSELFSDFMADEGDYTFDPKLKQSQLEEAASGTILGIHFAAIELLDEMLWGRPKSTPLHAELEALQEASKIKLIKGGNFSFLRSFSNVEIEWVVNKVVKPLTKADQCALLDIFLGYTFVDEDDEEERPLVAKANTFHSYTWKMPVAATFAALRETVLPETYLWWDIFCQNQWNVGDVAATFRSAISQVTHFMGSVPELDDPVALTRIWCLFEFVSAIKRSLPVQLITRCKALVLDAEDEISEPHRREIEALCEKDIASFFVDVRKAKATVASDIELIMGMVKKDIPGGADELNRTFETMIAKLVNEQLLRDAATFGSAKGVALILARGNVDTNATGPGGFTAAHYAAKCNAGDVIALLARDENACNLDAQDNVGRTPLHIAAQNGYQRAVDALLAAGVALDIKDEDGNIAADATCFDNIKQQLLEKSA